MFMNNSEKNLLILALSTLPVVQNSNESVMRKTTFQCPDGITKVDGSYQLEPIPKFLMQEYGLDRILLIGTKETTETRKKIILIDDNDKNVLPEEMSASEYFQSEISHAQNKSDTFDFDEYVLQNGDIAAIQDIENVIQHIQKYVENSKNQPVRIFLDIHGGPRSNAQMMTTLFSLLPMENSRGRQKTIIHADDIYSVIYNSEVNRIVHAGESFHLLDLVAGVHEFVEYGRTESLMRYKDDEKNLTESDGTMINTMDAISDALSIGDITRFDDAITRLREIENKKASNKIKIQQNGDEQIETESSGILERLVLQEYAPLISKNPDLLQTIRWCIDKKYYQLALTMCESKIPSYLCDRGVLSVESILKSISFHTSAGDQNPRTSAFNAFLTRCETHTDTSGGYFVNKLSNRKVTTCFYIKTRNLADYEMIKRFLTLHATIKNMRNFTNHLLEQDVGAHSVRNTIEPGFEQIKPGKICESRTELETLLNEYLIQVDKLIEACNKYSTVKRLPLMLIHYVANTESSLEQQKLFLSQSVMNWVKKSFGNQIEI